MALLKPISKFSPKSGNASTVIPTRFFTVRISLAAASVKKKMQKQEIKESLLMPRFLHHRFWRNGAAPQHGDQLESEHGGVRGPSARIQDRFQGSRRQDRGAVAADFCRVFGAILHCWVLGFSALQGAWKDAEGKGGIWFELYIISLCMQKTNLPCLSSLCVFSWTSLTWFIHAWARGAQHPQQIYNLFFQKHISILVVENFQF